jgi:hypothetical protein
MERTRGLFFATLLICSLMLAACRSSESLEVAQMSVDCSAVDGDEAALVMDQELAFDGTVIGTSAERNVNAGFQRGLVDDGRIQDDEELDPAELEALDSAISQAESGDDVSVGEIWPWTTFEVHAWFTADNGPTISVWTAGLEVEVGERWLIAGSAFATPEGLGDHFDQSGMAAACASREYSQPVAAEWEALFGGTVSPGSNEPENEPDPAVVAEVESRRRVWEQAGLDGYTFSGFGYFGDESFSSECPADGRLRIVVEAGEIRQAINSTETCTIPTDTEGLWTIDDMFDIAALVSGTEEWNIEWAEDWSYPRSVYGYDRSFEGEMYVAQFHPKPITAHFGNDLADALLQARAVWESRAVNGYTITIAVDCFCPPEIVSPVTVMVTDGQVVKALQNGREVEPDSLELSPLTIEELFELSDRPTGNVVVGFDPEYGFPTDIYDEGERNTIDDEIGYQVIGFEAAPIDLSEPKPQPPSDPGAVASDDPEVWQAEISELRASAGPGRLVGFVNLGGSTSTGFPLAASQPFCAGFDEFADIVPGARVAVFGQEGGLVGEGVLRGSAFDGHLGCVLWFGVDVARSGGYRFTIGNHQTDRIESAELSNGDWVVELWSDPDSLAANCESIPDPFANCLLLGEKG